MTESAKQRIKYEIPKFGISFLVFVLNVLFLNISVLHFLLKIYFLNLTFVKDFVNKAKINPTPIVTTHPINTYQGQKNMSGLAY